MKKILIILLVLSVSSIPFVSAHPFTDETIPNLSSNAPTGVSEVIVFFSEPVELEFSTIKVLDNNGNQIDNKDTSHYEDEKSLIVTTSPLEDGVYTVTTKVLSKVDGHLVPGAFLFAVGDVIIDPKLLENQNSIDLIFYPEAGARFPGIVGQTIVLGVVIASLMIWGTQNKQSIKEELEQVQIKHHQKFMSITGIGLMLVFISNILMIAVHTVRLETSPIETIETYFGTIWLARMIITIVLLGIWFVLDRKTNVTKRIQIPMLVAMLVLISTSSLIGHGAASGETPALILDYIHNLVAAVWIGGIFYFVFTLLPSLSKLKEESREKMSLALIPRFSIAFIISIGIVIITGPLLMWFLESDVGLITESVYGQLIILKITIASVMVALGGFFQFRVQRTAEKNFQTGKINVHKKLRRSLKVDAALGVVLLGVVALLTNGTLPEGEFRDASAQEIIYGFKTIEFTENAKFEIQITPFSSGINTILVQVSDFNNNPIYDANAIKVKMSNPSKNISPIEIPMEITKEENNIPIEFQGELTFGFSGEWQLEIESQRTENANESKIVNVLVKPRLENIQTQIVEYEFPETGKPLYPLYDGKNSIWISDPSAPRLWEFSLETQEFSSYSFNGLATMFLTMDNTGKIWFTDSPRNQIGYIDLETKEITTKTIPNLDPVMADNKPIFIQADFDDNIWITIVNKNKILKYIPDDDVFKIVELPERDSFPFALSIDSDGDIWYTATGIGKIGQINPKEGKITQYSKQIPLNGPEYLLFDKNENVWIAEHTGTAITKFNPVLETFESISVQDEEALPFGMTFDRYGNIWFAQHVVDSIGVYDPDNNDLKEVPISTEGSFIQFMTSDKNGKVWFVEQEGNKIGTVNTIEIPVDVSQVTTIDSTEMKYTEIASPLIALGIIATSLFFVKGIYDKRRLNSLINS
ncbi:CopD family protein [Nitrosopumilus sp.]|nr:CopD family protein [Nitrosopumilus sp.]MDB4850060.1 CopD family protein [Nitrosopumilus sp.]